MKDKACSLKQKIFSNWSGDLLGGVMTSVVALPIAMAFGVASGAGAAAGLYGAMACGFFASLFGGTKGQQSGPTGPIAVVVASLVVATKGDLSIVFAATILAGLFQIAFGRLGWGDLARYIPYPVVSGFMTGVAAIIIILHIAPFFGIEGSKQIMISLANLPGIPQQINYAALSLGIAAIAIIYITKLINKRAPASLIALISTTAISVFLQLEIPRIGEIPGQLPVPSLPFFDLNFLAIVVTGALTIALLGSVDSLLTSLIADRMLNSHHNSNKELIGQGIGNIVTGLLGGLAGAGSTTRTLANIDAGGRTPLAGIVYGLIIFSVIAFLGKIAALVPMASLAGILIWLGLAIVDWRALKHMTKAPKSDVLVMMIVMIMTVFVDLIWAVMIGCALSSVLFVKKMTDARLSECGTLDTFTELEHIANELSEHLRKTTYVYTFNGPMFFGETKNLMKALKELDGLEVLVLNFEFSPFIDQSCCYFLEDMITGLREKGKKVIILGLKKNVEQSLNSMDCLKTLDNKFRSNRWSEVIARLRDWELDKNVVA